MTKRVHNPNICIGIDGPAGAGKGSLARMLAKEYRMKYLDTGTLYRLVALRVMQAGGDPANEADAIAAASGFDFDFRHMGNNQFAVFVNGEDITAKLRTPEVGVGASKVAFFTGVRQALHDLQVNFVNDWKEVYGVILDGRDICTEIYPQADIKLFLDASAECRAGRRMQEFHEKGIDAEFAKVLSDIQERDHRDRNREVGALKPATDSQIIDTTELDLSEVLHKVCEIVDAKLNRP